MPSDITSIEEVEAGGYTVRVGKSDKAGAWEATVISEGSSDPSPQLAGMFMHINTTSTTDQREVVEGPPVCAPHKWVAVGFAIEAYEWRGTGTDTETVPDTYDSVTLEDADIDADELAAELDADFPGPWDPDGSD